ncbi:MAG: hypothetical protein BWY84_00686 [Candidatus Aerophobetes bacterium ADurb.Bin490]|nr:MAG: hypothetical protein BWY84_00686 [Candidatus Aerophobetes bacterium ADurb.Bin490]
MPSFRGIFALITELTASAVPSCSFCSTNLMLFPLYRAAAKLLSCCILAPATTVMSETRALRHASITCASMGLPLTSCRTFVFSDFILVPLPAASITADIPFTGFCFSSNSASTRKSGFFIRFSPEKKSTLKSISLFFTFTLFFKLFFPACPVF